jgi:predicted mannosyl-3-phosphoglycerate phosphatase (HAD superfamily)
MSAPTDRVHPARLGEDRAAIEPDPEVVQTLVYEAALKSGLPVHLAEEVAIHAPRRPRQPGRLLVACDLDRTLVYSARALGLTGQDSHAPRLVVAEVYQGVPISFCTRDAELLLIALAQTAELVPTTTRTRAQYERIKLPVQPEYAIAANGGHILVGGVPDRDWSAHVASSLESGCAPLQEIVEHLERISDPHWLLKSRVAEDLFAYLVVQRDELPAALMTDLSGWCASRGWTVSLQGRKVYCVPDPLTKSAAVAEIARRCAAVRTVAAGDSLLDADMLAAADEAVRPAHGELHDVAWLSARLSVTERAGVLGGQEICARLLAGALAVESTT